MIPDELLIVPGVWLVSSEVGTKRPPTPAEDVRRMVRHGLRGVLEWLGEPVGPAPGDPVYTFYVIPRGALSTACDTVALHPDAIAAIHSTGKVLS